MTATSFYGPKVPHTPKNPCPLCGNHRDLPSGHDIRCNGYTQGDYVWCQRIESPTANAIGTYKHYMKARCHCGVDHAGFTPQAAYYALPKVAPSNRKEARAKGIKRLNVRTTDYLIKTTDGLHVATKHRVDWDDENGEPHKITPWRMPNGQSGLQGTPSRMLPLYHSELLRERPGEPALLVEGESSADAGVKLKILTLGTVTGSKSCPDVSVLKCLKGRMVWLWPDADHDDGGLHHMQAIAAVLLGLGIECFLLDVERFKEIKDGFDIANWTGTDDELYSFLRSAQPFTPPLVPNESPAVVEAVRHLDARHSLRKEQRDRLADVFDESHVERLVERAEQIGICMERWIPAVCNSCGARPALILTCHDALCPLCFQRRFLNDWQARISEDPRLKDEHFRLVRYVPKEAVSGPKALKTLRNRFTDSRKYHRVQAGIIGNRCSRAHGGIMLVALPMECAVPAELGSFIAEVVSEGVGEREVSSWMLAEYEDEIREAIEAGEQGDLQYVVDWADSTKGRKRFSAFGKLYRTPSCSPDVEGAITGGTETVEVVSLAGFTGGSGHVAPHEKRKCPACGGRITKGLPYVRRDRVINEHGYDEWVPEPAY